MTVTFRRLRTIICVSALLGAAPAAIMPVAAAGPQALADGANLLQAMSSGSNLPSALHFVALPDSALARATGAGLTPPSMAIRIQDHGRVTLWDELNVKPSDLGTTAGKISVTINSR